MKYLKLFWYQVPLKFEIADFLSDFVSLALTNGTYKNPTFIVKGESASVDTFCCVTYLHALKDTSVIPLPLHIDHSSAQPRFQGLSSGNEVALCNGQFPLSNFEDGR